MVEYYDELNVHSQVILFEFIERYLRIIKRKEQSFSSDFPDDEQITNVEVKDSGVGKNYLNIEYKICSDQDKDGVLIQRFYNDKNLFNYDC